MKLVALNLVYVIVKTLNDFELGFNYEYKVIRVYLFCYIY